MLHCSEECTMIDIQDRAYCPVLEEIGEYIGNLRKDRYGKRSEMADDRCGRPGRGIRRCAASDRNPAGFTPLLDREGKPVVTPYQK